VVIAARVSVPGSGAEMPAGLNAALIGNVTAADIGCQGSLMLLLVARIEFDIERCQGIILLLLGRLPAAA
jgi:hypothetical protein